MEFIQIAFQRDLNEDTKRAIDCLERMEWPNSIIDSDDQLQILYYINATIISHVGVVFKQTNIDDTLYNVAGICGVLTHPKYRGKGYALKLLTEAILNMKQYNIDFSLFTCHKEVVPFYEKAGWIKTNNAFIGGTKETPLSSSAYNLSTMMNMLSRDAKKDVRLRNQDIIIELGEGKLW